MEYDKNTWYLTEDDIKYILLDQIRQVETMIFQHHLFKPNKLENSQAYIEWQQKKTLLEKSQKSIKKAIMEHGYSREQLVDLMKKEEE